MTTERVTAPQTKPPLWRNETFLKWAAQLGVFAGIVALFWVLGSQAATNLDAQGREFSFRFLSDPAPQISEGIFTLPEDGLASLGTGIVNTAIKAAMASEQLAEKVIRLMAALNRDAARIMADFDISACTDVTGFGLLGHLAEMVIGSGFSARIVSGQVPLIPEAEEFAAMGLIPAGAYKNREFREQMITFAETVPRTLQDLLFDPQTSGGLLISVSDAHCDDLVAALKDAGITDAARIGEVVDGHEENISVI